ncbi:esterase/lipase family protein [Microbulbifer halophilus]|uniref:Esterase/lipase family protein n=1 Tax=Microbulbifer halophilus TaxID=453963 RepID=A0ABW5EIW2_9GAMM|nr:alpha/beta fold hydrolase [Microbulbifer halophilus]MCW8128184.1 alpha/beta fold hydrolase [Microbulbifer halophilus]
MRAHVVFVHGLSGHLEKTWTVKGTNSPELWPKWLAEDISGIGLWLVDYPAAKTNWRGHGMPLSDRADNILARLLLEPRLARGNIIFVVHSLGGLVVEQLLRNAYRDITNNRKTEDFLTRVRRIAFLGTPHRGSLHANIINALWLLARPSASTRDLAVGNPQLRDLNFWYRQYSRDNGIQNLVLAEGRPERFLGIALPETLGTVVSPNSADAGLPETPKLVDHSHISICKPANREDDVYVLLKDFIINPVRI